MKPASHHSRAFTLVELLIVVGIISILASIAVPNMMEAQTRAKVSRAKADIRTIATAIEAYRVDAQTYPGGPNMFPQWFTTPVAYITSFPREPFPRVGQSDRAAFLTRADVGTRRADGSCDGDNTEPGTTAPQPDVLYTLWAFEENRLPINERAAVFYGVVAARAGKWAISSRGPDNDPHNRTQMDLGELEYAGEAYFDGDKAAYSGHWREFDPTNGATSSGNIFRTQINPDRFDTAAYYYQPH